jgi:hypothetical protein
MMMHDRDLSKNYLKDYPVKFSLSQLRTLNLSTNSMTSFEGNFPNLTTLYVVTEYLVLACSLSEATRDIACSVVLVVL